METQSPWSFDKTALSLVLHAPQQEGPQGYDIDLEQCCTSAEVLDWIMQVASKQDVSDRVLAWLVRDLRDLLGPQSTLCTGGIERGPINIQDVLSKRQKI